MYKAHSKDINRNKSFHPLTFENLSKVERLKAKEAEQKEEQEKRRQELQRDQEERRYNELVHAGLGTDAGATGPGQSLPVKRIFAAEYEKDEAKASAPAPSTAQPLQEHEGSSQDVKRSGLFSKFHREPATAAKREREEDAEDASCNDGSMSVPARDGQHKRARGDTELPDHKTEGSDERTEATTKVTGYVSTSEASRLRKEYELLKKQKVDPLRRVQEYQNRTVAAAAAAKQREVERHQSHPTSGSSSSEQSAIRDRIRKLMEIGKGR